MEAKKVFAIAILALMLALAGYSLAQDAQTTAINANFTVNTTGNPAISDHVTFVNSSSINASQSGQEIMFNSNTITKITCSGGVICSMSLDGNLFLTNITGSNGVTTTTSLDDNIILSITGSGGITVTYI